MSYKVNRLLQDDFGRISGVIAVNKPVDITSHAVVDQARLAFKTKQVGHAGALDPFATGVLILLIGKATKYSELFLNADKEYIANFLLGIQTDSADTEGKILSAATKLPDVDDAAMRETLQKFTPSYKQFVPVFSSVKVGGEKLRVLARSSDRFELEDIDGKRIARFYKGEKVHKVIVPEHVCKIPEIELLSSDSVNIETSAFYQANKEQLTSAVYPAAQVRVVCSKGTYIRALAEDIGAALPQPQPAMLYQLQRTRVGDIHLSEALDVSQLASAVSAS